MRWAVWRCCALLLRCSPGLRSAPLAASMSALQRVSGAAECADGRRVIDGAQRSCGCRRLGDSAPPCRTRRQNGRPTPPDPNGPPGRLCDLVIVCALSLVPRCRAIGREPTRRSGVVPAVGSEGRMEDLENCLSAIGYRPVQMSAECWQVSRVGETAPTPRIAARLSERIRLAARFCGSGSGGSAASMRRRSIEYGGPCRVE